MLIYLSIYDDGEGGRCNAVVMESAESQDGVEMHLLNTALSTPGKPMSKR